MLICKAVCWQSVCLGRNKSDKGCGLLRLCSERICKIRYFPATLIKSAGKQRYKDQNVGGKAGRSCLLRKGRQDQPRSDLYRWWSGDQCQLTEVRNPYCKCLLQNTGSGDKNSAGLIVKCKMETADANRKQSIVKNNGKLKKSVAFHCFL